MGLQSAHSMQPLLLVLAASLASGAAAQLSYGNAGGDGARSLRNIFIHSTLVHIPSVHTRTGAGASDTSGHTGDGLPLRLSFVATCVVRACRSTIRVHVGCDRRRAHGAGGLHVGAGSRRPRPAGHLMARHLRATLPRDPLLPRACVRSRPVLWPRCAPGVRRALAQRHRHGFLVSGGSEQQAGEPAHRVLPAPRLRALPHLHHCRHDPLPALRPACARPHTCRTRLQFELFCHT